MSRDDAVRALAAEWLDSAGRDEQRLYAPALSLEDRVFLPNKIELTRAHAMELLNALDGEAAA